MTDDKRKAEHHFQLASHQGGTTDAAHMAKKMRHAAWRATSPSCQSFGKSDSGVVGHTLNESATNRRTNEAQGA